MDRFLRTDAGIYVASGLFAVLMFVFALAALALLTPVSLGTRELVTFTVGFLLFIAVYFTAMAVYRGIDSRN